MLADLHRDIICVQQDIRLHYHKSNHDHRFISHSVVQTAPLRLCTMSLNVMHKRFHGGSLQNYFCLLSLSGGDTLCS